ncbi:acyltransferase family protein [Bergeyella porcorum]|uniref:acyltransferase family protein n=1 Tax=Bergeyella porcorum TaxID=1735111 RepID=UPI0035EEC157
MLNKNTTKQFFPALTGFRAIAAWIIFVYHFFPFKNVNHSYPEWIADVVWEFHIGVDMFFVLSGFLITYRYFDDHPIDFKKYMTNRVARIYPMYFLITVLVFIVRTYQAGFWTTQNTIEAILSFTMTKALFSDYFSAGISQGWTLTLEEMFYLTAPFYFILIRKNKWWLYLLPFLIFIFGTSLKTIFENFENLGGFLNKNISTYIIEFFTGIGLALLMLKSNFKPNLKGITYIGIFFISLYCLTISDLRSSFSLKSDIGRFIEMGLLSILGIAPLFWGLIHEKTIVSKILSLPIMILLGKASYIFYLIHKGVISIFIDEHIWSNKAFLFISLNIISIILFKYIEEPANHWIRKRFSK